MPPAARSWSSPGWLRPRRASDWASTPTLWSCSEQSTNQIPAELRRSRTRTQARESSFGFGDFDGAEAGDRAVDEEGLDRDVGLDVGLRQEGDYLAPGELLDRLLVAVRHYPLEVLAHGDDAVWLAAAHYRLLERGEAAAPHHDDDDVIQRVGLGLHRTATVMLSQKRDDAVRDRGEQPPARERGGCFLTCPALHGCSFVRRDPRGHSRPLSLC